MRRGNRADRDRNGQRPLGRGGRGPRGGRPFDDAARLTAYRALLAVHRDEAYANLVLPSLLTDAGLSGRDAAFATELTYGTLRTRGALDPIIARAAGREVGRIDPPARDALRLGAYQLLYTRVPAHAAVASTVDLVRAVAPEAVGFSNAVMRRISEQDLETHLAAVAPSITEDPVGHLAVVHSHPEWIVRAFREALGDDLDETERALIADNERPEVHLCARPGLLEQADLVEATGGTPGAFSPYAVYLPGGSPGDLAEIRDGRAHVQDEGSQLVALALANAPLEGRDETWLDLCAGPGGKAGLLAALAAQRNAYLTAVEVNEQRAAMVSNAVRGLPVTVLREDGRTIGMDSYFDRAIVDAPCTGLGSLRRRPESRWRKQPSDLPPLTKLQRELLMAALSYVRVGGVVAYVTCSPHLVETRLAVQDALRRGTSFTAEQIDAHSVVSALVPNSMPGLGDDPETQPWVQLWPHRHGTDAMFLALLRRTS